MPRPNKGGKKGKGGKRKRAAEDNNDLFSVEDSSQSGVQQWLDNDMVGRRVVEETRKAYTTTFKFLSAYAVANIPGSCGSNGLLTIPLKSDVWMKLLDDMALPLDDVGRIRAFGTIQSYISSIKFFYEEAGFEVSNMLNQNISNWMDGYKRKIADLRAKGIMKNKEGKLPLSYLHYERLSELALFASSTRAVSACYVHVFMVLCWNLFARSCSVSDLYYHHFSWDNDSLVIDMSKHKADQAGERITPKHIYANPYKPATCPFLALALHVFSTAFRADGEDKDKLFLSKYSYDTFCKWFGEALRSMSNLGFQPEDYGTHSFRKGIASFVAGFIGGPGIISIFLRAGWSVGPVQDRYLTYADGGDQLCGRVACGLNFNDGSKFAVLPPTFANPFTILSEEEWNFILPGYQFYPASFRGCLPYLLASLAFHWDWITARDESDNRCYKNISASHPIFRSRIFHAARGDQRLIEVLHESVLPLNTDGACEVTDMRATGIPPHIDQARQIEKLRAENEKLRELLLRHHIEIMDELPKRVTECFRETISSPGIQQMSVPELKALLTELIAVQFAARERTLAPPESSSSAPVASGNFILQGGYGMWLWRGRWRKIPVDYRFPGGSLKEVCDLYYFGLPAQQVRPFRDIPCGEFVRADEANVSKAGAVFDHVCAVAVETGLAASKEALLAAGRAEWDRVFKAVFTVIVARAQGTKKRRIARPEEKSYVTILDWTRHASYGQLNA